MRLFLTFFIGLYSAFIAAQTGVSINGRITDDTKSPQEFINIILFSSVDSSIVKTAASGSDGQFEIVDIKAGNYFIETSFVGFSDYESQVFRVSDGENYSFGTIEILSKTNETATADIVFVKPLVEVRSEKTIFNVEGTINSTGLNAMEVLRKAPGVMLDNNENISVKGRSGIVVYIDGKLSPLSGDGLKALLKSLPSSDIESIEIITNPSAKYDAAGSAGIINIKLKKNKNFGTNGSVQLGYAIQMYSKYNGSITLNHRNAKWNLYGTYSLNDGKNWSWMNIDRTQDSTRFEQKTVNTGKDQFHNLKAGADYYLNTKNTIGLMVSGNISDNSWNGNSQTNIYARNSEIINTLLLAQTGTATRRNNITGNLNYHFADTTGKDFTADIDYGSYSIRTNTLQPNTYQYLGENIPSLSRNYRFITPVDVDIISAKADYEQDAFGGKLGIGFKSSYVQTQNTMDRFNITSGMDVLDSTLSNRFKYNENINALYVNYNRKFNKLGLQTGLRGEQTVSQGILSSYLQLSEEENRDVSRSYINFFPSAAGTYNVNDTNQFSLTLSRRINRPSYQDLNPFEFKLDELSYQKGNPFLQPQFAHVAELTHTYLYALNTSLTYSYTKDVTASVMDIANDSASYIQERNLGFEEWIGLNISSPIPINKWWNAFVNINAGTKRVKADFNDIDIRVYSYSFYGQSSFTLPKKYSIEISGWYSGPSVWGGTFVTKPMGSMDIGAKKTFWDDKASLRIAVGDIFYTMKWRSDSSAPIVARTAGGWESRQFRVNFSYSFGNQNIKARERKSGADDLNKRVK